MLNLELRVATWRRALVVVINSSPESLCNVEQQQAGKKSQKTMGSAFW